MKIEIKSIIKFGDCIQVLGEIPDTEYTEPAVDESMKFYPALIKKDKKEVAIPRLGIAEIEFSK